MKTSTAAIEKRLEEAGCEFRRRADGNYRWVCTLDGQILAEKQTRSECIIAAAKALGEPV